MNPANQEATRTLLKKNLKILLYRLAAESETPSQELEAILQDVITELYQDAKAALEVREEERSLQKSRLKLVHFMKKSEC